MAPTSPASRPPTTRSSRSTTTWTRSTELFDGASVVLQHASARSAGTATRSSRPASPPACHYLDTTGEQDWLITCDEQYGADFAAAGPAARARRRADVHHRRDRRPALPGDARPGHPRHRGPLGRLPDLRLDPDDLQRRLAGGVLPRAERVRRRGTPRPASYSLRRPRPARARAGAAVGRHLAPGLVQATTRAWPTCKASGGVFNRGADGAACPQIVAAAIEATKDMAPTSRRPRSPRPPRQVMSQMPPRENPRLNNSLDSVHASGPARPRALRDPRQPATTSRPGCCRRTRRTRCSSSRRSGSASPPAARRSGTASCSACCAASGWCSSRC